MRIKIIVFTLIVASVLAYAYSIREEIGYVYEVDEVKREVHISMKSGQMLNIGDRLQVETDNGKIVLEVTFPMQTLSKCKITGKGKFSQLSKGMKVYRYSKDQPVDEVTVYKPGDTKVIGDMEFCYIPGGTFVMGSPESEKDRGSNEKQHQVTISSFWMGKYEVTQKQYKEIMGINPSHFEHDDNYPVQHVSWYDAVEFCNELSKRHGFKTFYNIYKKKTDKNNHSYYDNMQYTVKILKGNGFRLPTEAEWEYAARAGTSTPFYFGNCIDSSMANFFGAHPYSNNGKCPLSIGRMMGRVRGKPIVVGNFKPNAYGLYDMHGNVWEWCWDWYGGDYYSKSPVKDPLGPDNGENRVIRGGNWNDSGAYLRSACRFSDWPSSQCNANCGFRVVRSSF